MMVTILELLRPLLTGFACFYLLVIAGAACLRLYRRLRLALGR